MTPEGRVKLEVTSWLECLKEENNLPLEYFRRQAGGFSYKKGVPDLYGIFNGLHFEIETKRYNGQQSVMQEKWQAKLEAAGSPYFLVDDIGEFKEKFLLFIESHL